MRRPARPSPGKRAVRLVLVSVGISLTVALGAYATIGSTMRYSGDDYCHGATLTMLGFWKAQSYSYLIHTASSGNRYAVTFFADLVGLLGPSGNAILPGLTIASWVVGLAAAIYGMARLARVPLGGWESAILSGAVVFLSIYQSPELPQTVYWRSGLLPYLAPLVAESWLVALGARQALRPSVPIAGLILTAVLAVVAGGFSETAASLQLGLLIGCTLLVLLARRSRPGRGHALIQIAMASLAGAALATILLIVSPTNQPKLEQLGLSAHPGLLSLMSNTIAYTRDFVVGSLLGLPLPSLITFLVGALAAVLAPSRPSQAPDWAREGLRVVAVLGLGVMVMASSVAPSVWAQSGYPEPRALMPARFVMVLMLVWVGWRVGSLTRQLAKSMPAAWPNWLGWGALAVAFLLSIYVLRAASGTLQEWPKFENWSHAWDARDRYIRSAKDEGIVDISVRPIDHVIPHVGELGPDPLGWYNVCAAGYYGVRSIRAVLSTPGAP